VFTTEHTDCTESKHQDFLGGRGDLGGWDCLWRSSRRRFWPSTKPRPMLGF